MQPFFQNWHTLIFKEHSFCYQGLTLKDNDVGEIFFFSLRASSLPVQSVSERWTLKIMWPQYATIHQIVLIDLAGLRTGR